MLPRELRQYSNRKLFIVLGAIIVVAFIATAASLMAISALVLVRQVGQTNNSARTQLQALLLDLRIAESSNRGYFVTGDLDYLGRYKTAASKARSDYARLEKQTAALNYHDAVVKLGPLIDERIQGMERSNQLNQAAMQDPGQDPSLLATNLEQSKPVMDRIDSAAESIMHEQTSQVSQSSVGMESLITVARDISIATLILTLILAATIDYLYAKAIKNERELDQAKDEFVSLASHQLRTPATGIKSILATLVAEDFGPLNQRQAYFMRKALESNERELGIIEELLNVAKVDAGRLMLNPGNFDMRELVATLVSEQRRAIEDKHITLHIRQPDHPVQAYADEEKLLMAAGNLLDNARKYTPEGGTITLTLRGTRKETILSIADTGMGIDSAEIAHIFDRFQRSRDVVSGHIEGTGLGLYLAQKVAQLHNGGIEVSSKKGQGSRFVLKFPYRKVPDVPQDSHS